MGQTVFDVVFPVLLLGVGASFAAVSRVRADRESHARECSNHLRQIGLATVCYGDDKRSYPHFTRMRALDGDHRSDTAARAMNKLLHLGYLEDPRTVTCPGSSDSPSGTIDLRPLVDATELSYGWTRRGLNGNSRSNYIVAADKARRIDEDDFEHQGHMRGNHRAWMQAVCIDAHVQRVLPDGDGVTTRNIARATSPTDSIVGVLED